MSADRLRFQLVDEFMEKYGLQDQDWRKQMMPKN